MGETAKEFDEKVALLFTRGEVVLDALRSMATEARQSHESFPRDAQAHFDEVDAVVEKLGIGGVVLPALDHLASAWLGALQREVRFFDLVSEIETIHEELFAIVSRDATL